MDRVVYTDNVARTSEPLTLSLAAMGFLVGGGATAGALAVNSALSPENKKKLDEFITQDHFENIKNGYRQVGEFVKKDHVKNIQEWWNRSPPKNMPANNNGGGGVSVTTNQHLSNASHVPPLSTIDPHYVAKHAALHP